MKLTDPEASHHHALNLNDLMNTLDSAFLISSSFIPLANFESDAKNRVEVVHYISVFICLYACLMDHSNPKNSYINYCHFQDVLVYLNAYGTICVEMQEIVGV